MQPPSRRGRLRPARSRRRRSHVTDRHALLLSPATRAALGSFWRRRGECELASVLAFRDLGSRLSALSAPSRLVERTALAAQNEADHAQRCFDLAGRYLGESLRPGRRRRLIRLPRSRPAELRHLAVAALRDGVLHHGQAAWLAATQAIRATDPRVRDTLLVIARDEARHGALAADVLQWCVTTGGPVVAVAVRAAALSAATQPTVPRPPAGLDGRILAQHGWHPPDDEWPGRAAIISRLTSAAGPAAACAGMSASLMAHRSPQVGDHRTRPAHTCA